MGWKMKKKYFPKLKPTLPLAKKNLKGQLITNPEELKDLYMDTLSTGFVIDLFSLGMKN